MMAVTKKKGKKTKGDVGTYVLGVTDSQLCDTYRWEKDAVRSRCFGANIANIPSYLRIPSFHHRLHGTDDHIEARLRTQRSNSCKLTSSFSRT